MPLRDRSQAGRFVKSHGATHTRTYGIWGNMLYRCSTPTAPEYRRYGGRGIFVCDRWRSFENFLADMGEVPEGMSIERRDNDGGYEPGNCRWATALEQAQNRSNSIRVNGLTPRQIATSVGLPLGTVQDRIRRGWSADRIFNQPHRQSERV